VLALRALIITLLSPRTAAGVKSNFPTVPVAACIARRKTPGHGEVPLLQSPRSVFHFSHLSVSNALCSGQVSKECVASTTLSEHNQPGRHRQKCNFLVEWTSGSKRERERALQTWAGRRKVVWKIFIPLQYFQRK
jgi:hypothetical protein